MSQPMSNEEWHELKMLDAEFTEPWNYKAREAIIAEMDRLREGVKQLTLERDEHRIAHTRLGDRVASLKLTAKRLKNECEDLAESNAALREENAILKREAELIHARGCEAVGEAMKTGEPSPAEQLASDLYAEFHRRGQIEGQVKP